MKPKILVTGWGGFLGKQVIPLLEKSFVVQKFLGDIRDVNNIKKQVLDDLYGVVHLAGVIAGSDKIFVEVNIVGTIMLLEVLQEKCPRLAFFIGIGSAAEYGNQVNLINENDICQPTSMYGHSKLIATKLIQSWQKYTGIPSVVLRPFNIIGPNQPAKMLPAKLTEFFSQRSDIIQIENVNKEATRDWIDVRDVSDVIWKLTTNNLKDFEIFNLGTGNSVSNQQLIEVFSGIWKKQYAIGKTVYPPDSLISNSSKIQDFLKWTPNFGLSDSVQQIFQASQIEEKK